VARRKAIADRNGEKGIKGVYHQDSFKEVAGKAPCLGNSSPIEETGTQRKENGT